MSLTWTDNVTPLNAVNMNNLLQQDEVNPPGARLVANKLLAADAQPAFQINGDGKIQWGPGGATVMDANLYRDQPGFIRTDGGILATPLGPLGYGAFYTRVAGDAPNWRWVVQNDGRISWGPGNAGFDTVLYRYAASRLGTDSEFTISRPSPTADPAITIRGQSDAVSRYSVRADGQMQWGDGTNVRDTTLSRTGSNVLSLSGNLVTGGPIYSGNAVYAGNLGNSWGFIANNQAHGYDPLLIGQIAGQPNWMFNINTDGSMSWGPGNAAQDVNLFRQAGNILATNNYFNAGGGITANNGSANQISLGGDGHLYFSNASDVSIYKNSAGSLQIVAPVATGISADLYVVGAGANGFSGLYLNMPGLGWRQVKFGNANSMSGGRGLYIDN